MSWSLTTVFSTCPSWADMTQGRWATQATAMPSTNTGAHSIKLEALEPTGFLVLHTTFGLLPFTNTYVHGQMAKSLMTHALRLSFCDPFPPPQGSVLTEILLNENSFFCSERGSKVSELLLWALNVLRLIVCSCCVHLPLVEQPKRYTEEMQVFLQALT